MIPGVWKMLRRVTVIGLLTASWAWANVGPVCLKPVGSSGVESTVETSNIPDDELLARLVYAEAASTGFPDDPLVHEAIAWGVMNRVRLGEASPSMQKRYGRGIRGVLFKKGQFNPAVSPKSPFSRDFFCPGDRDRWTMAQTAARIALKGVGNPFIRTPWEKQHGLSLVVNFYYPSSIQAKGPHAPWEDSAGLRFVEDARIGDRVLPPERIRFYRLTWPPGDVRPGG